MSLPESKCSADLFCRSAALGVLCLPCRASPGNRREIVALGARRCEKIPKVLLTAEARRRRDMKAKGLLSEPPRLCGKNCIFSQLCEPWENRFPPRPSPARGERNHGQRKRRNSIFLGPPRTAGDVKPPQGEVLSPLQGWGAWRGFFTHSLR